MKQQLKIQAILAAFLLLSSFGGALTAQAKTHVHHVNKATKHHVKPVHAISHPQHPVNYVSTTPRHRPVSNVKTKPQHLTKMHHHPMKVSK